MARIGRQIPHFDSIDLTSIEAAFSEDMKYRYILSMKYSDSLVDQGRTKSLAVIMKNPSSADEKMSDATIRKVETFVYHRFKDVRYLHILNIFAYRATEPGDLNDAYKDAGAMEVIGEENDRAIENCSLESDYIILGWGNSSGIDKTLYEERILRVKHLLGKVPRQKLFRVSGAKTNVHPLHGLMWGYEYDLIPVGTYLDDK